MCSLYAVSIVEQFGANNLNRRAESMKYDPKLVKKIVHSKLIACSTEVGIKNADKVTKEMLIPAYLDAVENAEGGGTTLSAGVVNMYNEIVTTLGLDKEEEPAVAVPETPAVAEPEPATAPVVHRASRPSAPAKPPPTVAAPKPPKEPKPAKEAKPPKERKVPPKRYTRIDAMASALAEMKGGGLLDDLYNKSSELYIANGGSDKIIEATFFTNVGLTALQAVGYFEISETEFKLVKK
jgi:hypothetical protein